MIILRAALIRRKVDLIRASTATIPIVFLSPTPVELGLVRSLTTAKSLGLTIPQAVLSRADKVVQ
jgi:hypothetical protein